MSCLVARPQSGAESNTTMIRSALYIPEPHKARRKPATTFSAFASATGCTSRLDCSTDPVPKCSFFAQKCKILHDDC